MYQTSHKLLSKLKRFIVYEIGPLTSRDWDFNQKNVSYTECLKGNIHGLERFAIANLENF